MGTPPFARVPHAVLEEIYGPEKRLSLNDIKMLAYMYRYASHPGEKQDGVFLADGQMITSHEIAGGKCGLTKKQARIALNHLKSAGHIENIGKGKGESGQQYTIYAVRGLYDIDYYGKKASGEASTEQANKAEKQAKKPKPSPAKGQAVGQASSTEGQAVEAEKSKEIPAFFDAGGTVKGTQYIDIINQDTDTRKDGIGTYTEAKGWSTLNDTERADVLSRMEYAIHHFEKRSCDNDPSKRSKAQRRCSDFARWHRTLRSGSPQEKEKAYSEYIASSTARA